MTAPTRLRAFLPRRARCIHWRPFPDGEYRQCCNAVGWIALLFGGMFCREHAAAIRRTQYGGRP